MTGPMDRLADRSVARGAQLACMVRDEGREAIGEFLDGLDVQDLYGLAVALAAMVPIDRPASDLLEWIDWADESMWSQHNLRAAHAAYSRGIRDDFTITGERVYQRHAGRRRRTREGAAA